MTAASPYAPPRRNSLLRRSSSVQASSGNGRGTAVVAVVLFIIRYWKEVTNRQAIWDFLKQRPSVFSWIKQWLAVDSSQSTVYRSIFGSPTPTSDTSVQSINDTPQSDAGRIQDNHEVIRTVLEYWFGQYTPENAQKNLWMIAGSSVQLRDKVDKEISEKFEQLLRELASEEPSARWSEWCEDPDGVYGYQAKLAVIIVLDQFSRHIQRYRQSNNPTDLPAQTKLDALALKAAQLFTDRHNKEIRCGMVPLPMYIFGLMPYRHASTIESVQYVQKCVEDCDGMNDQLIAMLGRFRKATNRRMALLQDEARRTGQTTNLDSPDVPIRESGEYKDEDILETFPFQADLKSAVNHPVHKTIVTYLEKQGIRATKGGKKTQPCSPVIVSLSGGVDSMVIASVLANLNKTGYNLKVIAVHIDYANRPESGAEAEYVGRFCDSHDITFQLRRIDQVTRGITARDDYERISRELRYDSYRKAVEFAKNEQEAKDLMVGVMLGHHKGDVRENVLSNAHKGCGPLDLSGMTPVSTNDGVTIYRPLLPLEKSSVLDYAHKFGVPYFKDTTPSWSTRGKLRNKLLPLLGEIFGEGSMKNLSNLATESDECRALLHSSMIGPFLDQIERKPMGIMFHTTPWKQQADFFWKFVLRAALHSASLGMFSDKSVMSFLQRVKAPQIRPGWLQCRRDYAVYLQEDGRVFVFYPSSFPWNDKDKYDIIGQTVPCNEEQRVGPWLVTSSIIEEESDAVSKNILNEKALRSMEELVDGQIEYLVTSPTWQVDGKFVPRPLAFRHFSKATRPAAWKKCDLKVQTTLPLLGNDEISEHALLDLSGNGLIHVVDGEEKVNPTCLIKVTLRLVFTQPSDV